MNICVHIFQTPHESAVAELSSCVLSLTSNLDSLCDNLNHVQVVCVSHFFYITYKFSPSDKLTIKDIETLSLLNITLGEI